MSWLERKMRDPFIALAAGQFGIAMMQTLFMFYYVKVYLNYFVISEAWFATAQAFFLVWNAINDPLFGYLQDSSHSWLSDRRLMMRYLAPFMALSFVFLWVDVPYEQGFHLCVALFFYDAFYSALGVTWSAMFAEMEGGLVGRASAMKHSQIAILLSVNVIPIAEKVSGSLENYGSFQVMCLLVAVVGWACMRHCSTMARTLPLHKTTFYTQDEDALLGGSDEDVSSRSSRSAKSPAKDSSMNVDNFKQILSNPNFISAVAVNLIHNARSVMHMNFASISTELLIPSSILPKGSIALALFYGMCTLAPQIIIILSEGLVVRRGAHSLMQLSFLVTVVASIILYFFSASPFFIMLYMFIDSVAVHSSAPLFNIVFSEVIEDDTTKNRRSKPLSSMVFGLNALFVKPAQSIAPLLVVYYLNRHGYEAYKTAKTFDNELQDATRSVLFLPPLILSFLQYFAFTFYRLGEKNKINKSSTVI